MKPHLAYINNTLIKKQLAKEAKNEKTSYVKYRTKVDKALKAGYPAYAIISELENEIVSIMATQHQGDAIFQEGVHNSKVACISAIRIIIAELKGEK